YCFDQNRNLFPQASCRSKECQPASIRGSDSEARRCFWDWTGWYGQNLSCSGDGSGGIKERTGGAHYFYPPCSRSGGALGFLPGDLEQKILPYLRPLYDALREMLEPEEMERAIARQTIEVAPLAYMRGRTLSNAFVILDEAQNTTTEQMFMLLTRI